MAAACTLTRGTIDAVVEGRHRDPFAVLGVHETNARCCCARSSRVRTPLTPRRAKGNPLGSLKRRHAAGFFEGVLPQRTGYLLRAANAGGQWTVDDAYAYGPVLGPLDDWLLGEGKHGALYDRLGAHLIEHEGVAGAHFALWAPNARRGVGRGRFQQLGWPTACDAQARRGRRWEIFIPGLVEGALYKYEIIGKDGNLLPLKSGPGRVRRAIAPRNRIGNSHDQSFRLDRPALPRGTCAARSAARAHGHLRSAARLLAAGRRRPLAHL